MDIYKTLLLFALVCALSAFFVMWAKYEEQKVKIREERENYQAALRLHNGVAVRAQELVNQCEALNEIAGFQFERGVDLYLKNIKLQDRLSALLCPHNDHIWKDGVCTKCGRMHDA